MDINSECAGCPWEMGFIDGDGDVAADDGLGKRKQSLDRRLGDDLWFRDGCGREFGWGIRDGDSCIYISWRKAGARHTRWREFAC